MKKVISGRLYDTETAREVGEWDNGLGGRDFGLEVETLYRKRTGEYFLHGWGGAASRYAKQVGTNAWGSGAEIRPLTYEQAREWAERRLDADAYQEEFGPAPEGEGEAVHVHATVSETARRALDAEAARTGESRSAIIERLLLGLAS